MLITLPFPDKRLSPNARVHWSKRPVKQARADATKATWAICGGLREARAAVARMEAIRLRVTFYPPDRRQRDQDNLIASMKPSLDGIADALACNDAKFRATYEIGEPVKGGRVEVRLLQNTES